MMSTSIMFKPVKIGKLSLPNRFMRSATYEALSDNDGRPTKKLINMIVTLAKGEVGLIVPGAVYVTKSGQGYKGQSGLTTLEQSRMWQQCINEVHSNGSKFLFQIIHHGTRSDPRYNGGFQPSGPTALNKEHHELTNTEIEDIIQDFTDSTELAFRAGSDGVQIHAGHGYLLNEFLSPLTNRRNDKWGGNEENRARIIKEIISSIKKIVPENFSISIKLNGDDHIKGGITPELSAKYIDLLKNDFDFFEISAGGNYSILSKVNENVLTRGIKNENKKKELIKFAKWYTNGSVFSEMYNLNSLKIIKKSVPDAKFALVGGNRVFKDMEKVVEKGFADIISLSRPLLHDPFIVKKFKNNEIDRSPCISCGACLLNSEKGIYCHLPRK